MKNICNIKIVVVLLLIIFVGFFSFWWGNQDLETYNDTSITTSYDYNVDLTTDAILNNVTIYFPVPAKDNVTLIEQDTVDEKFDRTYPSRDYSLIETEYGPMILMKAEEIKPKYTSSSKSSEKVLRQSLDFRAIVLLNEGIETKNPIETSPVLMPKYNVEELGAITSQTNAMSYKYDSWIYAYYEGPADANVKIDITLHGMNEWWVGGWQSNSFRERITVELSGPQNEWTPARGELVAGEGTYLK